jgi:hypothetical protein
MAFVRTIKEDLNETQLLKGEMDWLTPEEGRLVLIKNLAKKFETFKVKYPTLVDKEGSYSKFTEEIEKSISKAMDTIFTLNNEIEDVIVGDFPSSKLLKGADWANIKKWLGSEFNKKKMKLLFRGTKDGMTGQAFHTACNNKGATITILKTNHGKICGGFMDQPWKSTNQYINTSKAFLFSITEKKKFDVNQTYVGNAGYDHVSYGPTWGSGHDLTLQADFKGNANYCNKNGYNFSGFAEMTGGYNFMCEEVEVYGLA